MKECGTIHPYTGSHVVVLSKVMLLTGITLLLHGKVGGTTDKHET